MASVGATSAYAVSPSRSAKACIHSFKIRQTSSLCKEFSITRNSISVVRFPHHFIKIERLFISYSSSDQWFLVVSTQMIGFSTGGITRRFLVSPPSMIWPATLVSCALFNTLHSEQYAGIGRLGGLSRERFFVYVFTSAFLWCMNLNSPGSHSCLICLFEGLDFFPGYLCKAHSL